MSDGDRYYEENKTRYNGESSRRSYFAQNVQARPANKGLFEETSRKKEKHLV